MSLHPAFQRGVGYGDRFDAEIVAARADGLFYDEIAARIGVSTWFIGCRARFLGCGSTAKRPLERCGGERPCPAPRSALPKTTVAQAIAGRRDEGPTRLARALRQRLLILDRDGLDPSHGVACLHLAGLTLPEIEGATGFPASAVVAAVRQHCAPLGTAR